MSSETPLTDLLVEKARETPESWKRLTMDLRLHAESLELKLTRAHNDRRTLREALASLIDVCDGNYAELVSECRIVLSATASAEPATKEPQK